MEIERGRNMKEEQVQVALKRIDQAVAQLSGTRETHTVLAQDLKLVEMCCIAYFAEKIKNERTDKQPERPTTSNKDS